MTVAGITQSNFNNTFPLINSYSTESDTSHAFFASFTPTGSLLQSSHIGGNANDYIWGVEIDSNNNFLLSGQTQSTNFPLTTSQQLNGSSDAFITQLLPGSFSKSPDSVILTPDHGEIFLEWQTPTQAGNLPIIEYRIYRSTSENGSYSLVGTSSILNYLDTSVTNGQTYWYAVVLVNSAGEGDYSTKRTTSLLFAPSAPINITILSDDSHIVLSWNLPLNDGYSPITWFNVYRSSTSGSSYVFQGSGTTTSFVDTNVVNGVSYFYVVTAVNDIGESMNSVEVEGTPQIVGDKTTTIENIFTTTDTETVTTGSEILLIYGIIAISVLIYTQKNHKRK